eukprot:1866069-Rhodomonas_salina.2
MLRQYQTKRRKIQSESMEQSVGMYATSVPDMLRRYREMQRDTLREYRAWRSRHVGWYATRALEKA